MHPASPFVLWSTGWRFNPAARREVLLHIPRHKQECHFSVSTSEVSTETLRPWWAFQICRIMVTSTSSKRCVSVEIRVDLKWTLDKLIKKVQIKHVSINWAGANQLGLHDASSASKVGANKIAWQSNKLLFSKLKGKKKEMEGSD